ncbi:MAG: hypothetical protein WC455_22170 [Dehalococcoidia bacterium]
MNHENIKTKHIAIKNLMIQNITASRVDEIIPTLEPGVMHNIITQKSINAFSILLSIIGNHEYVDELTILTYRMSYKTLKTIELLIDDGKIKKTNIIVNDNFRTLLREKAREMLRLAEAGKIKFCTAPSHAKISLIRAGDNHITIQGSGNYSTNPKIEQYTIVNDHGLYEFYYDYITMVGEAQKWQDLKNIQTN